MSLTVLQQKGRDHRLRAQDGRLPDAPAHVPVVSTTTPAPPGSQPVRPGNEDARSATPAHQPEDPRYHVTITLHRERDPVQVTLALTEAFSQGAPTSAMPSALSPQPTPGDVEVDFAAVGAATGPHDQAPVLEQLPVEQLARLEMQASALVPAIKALLALSGARRRAGLAPHHRMTIEVAPEGVQHLRWDETREL